MTENFNSTLEIISNNLGKFTGSETTLDPDSNIIEALELDSVKVLDLIMEIEDHFDISIPLNIMANVQTVRDLAEVIEQIRND
jgi:acyl carrier protein